MARIFLTEDEEVIRSLLAEVLAGAGYDVVEAESGDAATLLIDRPDALDALVTDIHMPGQLSGFDLGRRFRARHARSPIPYVTGRPDAARGVPMRPNREVVLSKPYRSLAVVATMQAMLAAEFAGAA